MTQATGREGGGKVGPDKFTFAGRLPVSLTLRVIRRSFENADAKDAAAGDAAFTLKKQFYHIV